MNPRKKNIHKKFSRTRLESQFITQSKSALASAWKQAQASGQNVVISENGAIYEIAPDGNRRLIKQIDPPTQVNPGERVTIR